MQKSFYETIGITRPRQHDSALYLLNGCLECQYGPAEATIRLHNYLSSVSLFNSCKKEDKIISSISVKLNSETTTSGFGTFSLGGILEARKCNGLFSSGREFIGNKIVLEVKHNCGRKKPMTLFVLLPPVNLRKLISDRNSFREWNGIHVDLAIFGIGWEERWLDFGDVYNTVSKATQQSEIQVSNVNSNDIKNEEKSQIYALPTPIEFVEETTKNNEHENKNYRLEMNSTFFLAIVLIPVLLGFSFSLFNYIFNTRFFKCPNKVENDYELGGGGAASITSSSLSQGTTHSSLDSRP